MKPNALRMPITYLSFVLLYPSDVSHLKVTLGGMPTVRICAKKSFRLAGLTVYGKSAM
jgi:hypothetical protein